MLTVALILSFWMRQGEAPPTVAVEPIRITNFGQLVAAIDPAGETWLGSPGRPIDPAAPRLIITLGDKP